MQLAEFYGRKLHELARPGNSVISIEPHLRTALGNTVKQSSALDEAIGELQHFAEDYRQLEQLADAQPFEDYPPPVRILDNIDIAEFAEDIAIRERSRLNLGDQPIADLRRILEEGAGLRIFYGSIPSTIAGLYAFVAELGYCILINRKHPAKRRRWTLAHEYMHFLSERHKPGVDYLGSERKPLNERYADAFAASFLMPRTGIRRHFLDISSNTGDFQVADLCRLTNIFMVSVQAMALRLEDLGLIRKGTWQLLEEKQFKPEVAERKLGLSDARPGDEDPYPERYKYLAVRAFCQAQISEGQLARFLRCDRVSAREIVADCINRSDDIDEDGNTASLSLPFEQSLLEA
jgi:Zn-dependent peptidase ImmA (M78 family)